MVTFTLSASYFRNLILYNPNAVEDGDMPDEEEDGEGDGDEQQKKPHRIIGKACILSGWQDSNLRPSAPKADALTGLRYTP